MIEGWSVRLRTAARRVETETAAIRLMLAAGRLRDLLAKANFDPDQPRVPAGNPDGGQGTTEGGAAPDPARRLPDIGTDEDGRPVVPQERPQFTTHRNAYGRAVAKWLVKASVRLSPVGRLIDAYEIGSWIWEEAPRIRSYLDGPKSLEELQAAVSEPRRGYDIHHIVEQGPARADGFDEALINGPQNRVRIPTYRHWEINAWYATKNDRFGGVSPRHYLRGKNWEERLSVGKEALIEYGVLEP